MSITRSNMFKDTLVPEHFLNASRSMTKLRELGDPVSFEAHNRFLDDMQKAENLPVDTAIALLNDQKSAWMQEFNGGLMLPNNLLALTIRRLRMLMDYSTVTGMEEKVASLLETERDEWAEMQKRQVIDVNAFGKILALIYQHNLSQGNI